MIKDRNKGISNITYNHLNLPTQIEFEGTTNKITYLYNSLGQKLKKTVVYSDSIKIVDYLDGFQYAGGELNFFPHPEGYVSVKRGGRTAPDGSQGYVFNYVFNYTDHLGNIRVSYSKDPQTNQLKILEENHYYPFGLKHSVYAAGRLRDFEVDFSNPEGEHVFLTPVTKTEYQYKYNGQEWQDELGLNMYAMDLRQYDPAIGRWVAQDPVTHFDYSPYSAFDNNPVFWADPSGADAVDIGYDRIVDSQDLMGSYHWSGGFQEIENEGGGETETQKGNPSSSEQRSSYDNGDPEIKDALKSSEPPKEQRTFIQIKGANGKGAEATITVSYTIVYDENDNEQYIVNDVKTNLIIKNSPLDSWQENSTNDQPSPIQYHLKKNGLMTFEAKGQLDYGSFCVSSSVCWRLNSTNYRFLGVFDLKNKTGSGVINEIK